MTDLEAKLREKIEKQLEERKKARLETGTGMATVKDDELSQQLEKKLNERKQTSRQPAAAPPQPSEPATPAIEVPPAEEPTPVVEEAPTPQVSQEPTPQVSQVPTPQVSQVPTPQVSQVPTPQVSQEPTPQVSQEPTPQVSQEPTPQVSQVPTPQVSQVPTPQVSQEPTPVVEEVSAKEVQPKSDAIAEVPEQSTGEPSSLKPREEVVESSPAKVADDVAKQPNETSPVTVDKETPAQPEAKTPETTDEAKEKKPVPPPPPPSDAKSKKKTGTRSKMPGGDKNRRTAPGKKTRMGTKASMGKTRGPSANRTLSDQEKKLLDEKSRIDEKFKKQKMIAYIAISGGTILLLIAMIVALKIIQNKRRSPSSPRVVHQDPKDKNPTSAKEQPPAKTAFASMDELKQAVDRMINVEKNTSAAVKAILAYSESTPSDTSRCEAMVETIAKEYLESGKASLLWQDMHTHLTLGSTSSNPEDVAKAIAALRQFAYRNSKEAFLADYMIQTFEKRYATLTGGLLP